MSNHQYGFSFCQFFQGLLDEMLIFGVGKSSRLIQYNDGSIFQDCTCQYDPLLFPAGEICSLRTNLRIQSSKDAWEKDLRINYTYEGKTVTTNYYKWNAKKQAYVLVPEMTVTMDNTNM